ncbi:MAG TPA: hypothetical protein VK914_12535 [bacterium]|jgi:hypothetical protein|nr:hypothetical protein [bacterium]
MVSKIAKITGAITLGAVLLGGVSRASAADAPTTSDSGAASQLAAAVQCERQAGVLQASIDEQLQLKAQNMKQWQNHKAPMGGDIADADKKYSLAIASLEDTQSGWLQLAHWHRLQAMELQTDTADLPTATSLASNN